MSEEHNVWSWLQSLTFEIVAIFGVFLLLLVFTDSIEVHTDVVTIKNGLNEFIEKNADIKQAIDQKKHQINEMFVTEDEDTETPE